MDGGKVGFEDGTLTVGAVATLVTHTYASR